MAVKQVWIAERAGKKDWREGTLMFGSKTKVKILHVFELPAGSKVGSTRLMSEMWDLKAVRELKKKKKGVKLFITVYDLVNSYLAAS